MKSMKSLTVEKIGEKIRRIIDEEVENFVNASTRNQLEKIVCGVLTADDREAIGEYACAAWDYFELVDPDFDFDESTDEEKSEIEDKFFEIYHDEFRARLPEFAQSRIEQIDESREDTDYWVALRGTAGSNQFQYGVFDTPTEAEKWLEEVSEKEGWIQPSEVVPLREVLDWTYSDGTYVIDCEAIDLSESR